MKLISWNICQGTTKDDSQDRKLMELNPDIVALQEVQLGVVDRFKANLAGIGLIHSHTTCSDGTSNLQPTGQRERGVLLASRWPFQVLSSDDTKIELRWPERLISVRIDHPDYGPVEIHNLYGPHSDSTFLEFNQETKEYFEPNTGEKFPRNADSIMTQTLNKLYDGLAREEEVGKHRILCGDFNMPHAINSDWSIVTNGDLRNYKAQNEAERKILTGLSEFDLTDVYKVLHPTRPSVESVFSHINRGSTKCLIDFIFASKSLNVVECNYLTDIIGGVLGDHTPVMAVFEPSKLN